MRRWVDSGNTGRLAEGPQKRGRQRREGNGKEHRRPEGERQRRHPHPEGPFVEHEVAVLPEGLGDHQGRKEGGRQKGDDRARARGQFLATDQNRPYGLDRGADDRASKGLRLGGQYRPKPTHPRKTWPGATGTR